MWVNCCTHFDIFSNARPLLNGHIAGVQQWIVLGDGVNNALIFALHVRQNQRSKAGRLAKS